MHQAKSIIVKVGYYKKIDRSMMDWGFTIPQNLVEDFLFGDSVPLGSSKPRILIWGKQQYEVNLAYVNRTNANPVYQLRWDSNRDFLFRLRQTFVQSYVILKSQKELFDIEKTQRKHFRTNLIGGQQEVMIFKPISSDKIEVKEFIVIENEWNALFQRLVRENVFGWIYSRENRRPYN